MHIQKKSKRLTKEKKEAVEDTKQENGSYIAIYGSWETFIESQHMYPLQLLLHVWPLRPQAKSKIDVEMCT